MTHRDKARSFLITGNIKQALKLAKTFDITYSKEEISELEIYYEVLSGRESFYKQLGVDLDLNKETALKLLDKLNQL